MDEPVEDLEDGETYEDDYGGDDEFEDSDGDDEEDDYEGDEDEEDDDYQDEGAEEDEAYNSEDDDCQDDEDEDHAVNAANEAESSDSEEEEDENEEKESFTETVIIGRGGGEDTVLYGPDARPISSSAGLDYLGNEVERIERINAEIARVAETDYRLDIHDTQLIVAAFNGECVMISTGLAAMLTDDELAAVLAHEHAHGISEHVQSTRSRYEQFLAVIAEIWRDPNRGFFRKILSTLFNGILGALSLQAHRRRQELDADKLAVELCRDAGYDPAALVSALRKGHAPEEMNFLQEIISTHPPLSERRYVILSS